MITCLATDFGRVLGTFQLRFDVLRTMAESFGGPCCTNGAGLKKLACLFQQRGTSASDQETYYDSLDRGILSVQDVWRNFLACFRIPESECSYAVFKHHWCSHQKLIPPIVAIYRRLQQHYPLVAISNGDKDSLTYFSRQLRLRGGLQFHKQYLSGVCALKKPELFDLAVAELETDGIHPENCVYIDDLPEYVWEAGRRGFQAFQFDATAFPNFEMAAKHLARQLACRGVSHIRQPALAIDPSK